MKRAKLIVVFFVLIGMLCAQRLAADLIFQMRETPSEAQWRESGSLLLEGVARVFDWLAAVEGRRPEAERHFGEAGEALAGSQASYAKLADSVKPGREVSLDTIPPSTRDRIDKAFRAFKVQVPTNEQAAAQLAASEIGTIIRKLKEVGPRIRDGDVAALQDLLSTVNRVERIGTYTALFFDEARKSRQRND